jgi:hypothetical protein
MLEPIKQPFGGPSAKVAGPKPLAGPKLLAGPKPFAEPSVKVVSAAVPKILQPMQPQKMKKPIPALEGSHRDIDPELRDTLDGYYATEENADKLGDYEQKQHEYETQDSYLLDTKIYIPQSRIGFYKFIQSEYGPTFTIPRLNTTVDKNACEKRKLMSEASVEPFLYQKFINEYIRNDGPYRGILVYHGLGSGKTCSSIAAAQSLYGMSNKKIIVMTPGALRGNFINEIAFCGFKHYNTNNYWSTYPLMANEQSMEYMYAKHVLSLSDEYLKSVLKRDRTRHVLWIADFTKPPNYMTLTQQQRDDIREQINVMINSRITFINYNGISAKKLKQYACQDTETHSTFFDNSIIVIDEFHNLTRMMNGKILPYIKDSGRKRKVQVEPIVPGRWVPSLCGVDKNYDRSYLFYKLLSDARNSKIIALSGTPVINMPTEIAIIANVLGGYIECVEFMLPNKAHIIKIEEITKIELRIDIVRFHEITNNNKVLLSVFPEGYEKVYNENGELLGIKHNKEAQEGIRDIFKRIKLEFSRENIIITNIKFTSYPRLPEDPEKFKEEFVKKDLNDYLDAEEEKKEKEEDKIKELVFRKRIAGLFSYYKGSKEEFMPRINKEEVVKCIISNYSLPMYITERKKEIEKELKKKGDEGDIFSIVDEFAKMKNPSSYRFRSRSFCNFTFPKEIKRPFPGSKDLEKIDVDSETITSNEYEVEDQEEEE